MTKTMKVNFNEVFGRPIFSKTYVVEIDIDGINEHTTRKFSESDFDFDEFMLEILYDDKTTSWTSKNKDFRRNGKRLTNCRDIFFEIMKQLEGLDYDDLIVFYDGERRISLDDLEDEIYHVESETEAYDIVKGFHDTLINKGFMNISLEDPNMIRFEEALHIILEKVKPTP